MTRITDHFEMDEYQTWDGEPVSREAPFGATIVVSRRTVGTIAGGPKGDGYPRKEVEVMRYHCFRHPTSDIRHPTSDIRRRTEQRHG